MATSDARGYLRELQKYGQDNPEWMALANQCISGWGKNGKQLQHCIAMALKDAHAMGASGIPPPKPVLQSIANDDVPRAPRQRIVRAGR
jgi:hypothetical protein